MFVSNTVLKQFVDLVFGSTEQYQRVMSLFKAFKDCNKPLFIITAGNALDVVATLVLFGLDQFVTGVYQTAKSEWSTYSGNRWEELPKWDVITKIGEQVHSDTSTKTYLHVDDDDRWHNPQNKQIDFIHVKTSVKWSDAPLMPVTKLMNTMCGEQLKHGHFCATYLVELTRALQNGSCTYDAVFFDWDNTLSPLDGPLPFTHQHFAAMKYLAHPIVNMLLPCAVERVQVALSELLSLDGTCLNVRTMQLKTRVS